MGKLVICLLIFREGELVQQMGVNGIWNSFYCLQCFFGNVFVGFNINNYIIYLGGSLQILCGDVDVLFGEDFVQCSQYVWMVFVDVYQMMFIVQWQ